MSENKRFTINLDDECIDDVKEELFIDFNDKIDFNELCDVLNELYDENQQLKYKNELLSDELEQAKAVINKKWSEYLKKKDGVILNDCEEQLQREMECYE